jgi:hypothetical protein
MKLATASVIIPAHNEERSIGRLLDAILAGAEPGEFEIVVVCNGCSDDTATVARQRSAVAQVIELEQPSKHWALVEGDRVAAAFPRLYVDADIELDATSVRELVAALGRTGVLAVAPERELVVDRSSRIVRSHYRVWSRLPVVRSGLFGRGVIGVSAEGHRRVADRPEVFGDDLYVHSRFAEAERQIVTGARSRVRAPLTTGDLIRRRTRAAEGNVQLAERGKAADTTPATVRSLLRLMREEPALLPHVPAFVAVTLLGRLNRRRRQRRCNGQVWLRDESSRT